MNRYKIVRLLLFAVLFICIGLLRDFIFVNWNYQLDYSQNQRSFSYAHSFFDFLNTFTYTQLYWGKWMLTSVFTLINFTIGWFYIKELKLKKQLLKMYITITIVALLIFLLSYLNVNFAYSTSRSLMGFLQSPIPTVVVLLAKKLNLDNKNI